MLIRLKRLPLVFSILISFFCLGASQSCYRDNGSAEGGSLKVEMSLDKNIFLGSSSLQANKSYSVYSIDALSDTNFAIGSYRNDKIIILDKELENVAEVSVPTPHGISKDSENSFFVTTFRNNRVRKFNSNYEEQVDWDIEVRSSGLIHHPVAIDHDENDNAYIALYSENQLMIVSKDGKLLKTFSASKDGEEAYPHDVLVYKKQIYVAIRNEGIYVFNTDGTFIKQFQNPPFELDPLNVKMFNEYVIVLNNNVESNPIVIYNLHGEVVSYLGERGDALDEFLVPTNSLQIGKNKIVIVEERSNRVRIFNLEF